MSLLKRIVLARSSVQCMGRTNFSNKAETWQSVHLQHRTLISVEGDESAQFLQGLITNDINSVAEKETPSMYCMFLNTGGRVLFDSIICPGFQPNQYIVEIDTELAKAAVKHLNMYRVRRKLKIEIMKNLNAFAVFNPNQDLNVSKASSHQTRSPEIGSTFCDGGSRTSLLPPVDQEDSICFPDPRVDLLGYRYLSTCKSPPEKDLPLPVSPANLEAYTDHRCRLGVPEGKYEILPAKALPLEHNVDYLHGVSFHKGCYIGQELTARTHHTGVIRKRILPIHLIERPNNEKLEPDTPILNELDRPVGKLRMLADGSNYGLAMLRLKETFAADRLTLAGVPVTTWKPDWWPQDKSEKVEDGSS